jgi:hypothetical protein
MSDKISLNNQMKQTGREGKRREGKRRREGLGEGRGREGHEYTYELKTRNRNSTHVMHVQNPHAVLCFLIEAGNTQPPTLHFYRQMEHSIAVPSAKCQDIRDIALTDFS